MACDVQFKPDGFGEARTSSLGQGAFWMAVHSSMLHGTMSRDPSLGMGRTETENDHTSVSRKVALLGAAYNTGCTYESR